MFGFWGWDAGELAVFMLFSIPLVAVIGGIGLAALKIIRGGRDSARDLEDTRLIQEMHQQLQKMEDRVGSLETILLDRERRDKS
jgi:phage shock protein B